MCLPLYTYVYAVGKIAEHFFISNKMSVNRLLVVDYLKMSLLQPYIFSTSVVTGSKRARRRQTIGNMQAGQIFHTVTLKFFLLVSSVFFLTSSSVFFLSSSSVFFLSSFLHLLYSFFLNLLYSSFLNLLYSSFLHLLYSFFS